MSGKIGLVRVNGGNKLVSIIKTIEYHFVKSGPSHKTSLCSADIFLNIHVLILYSGCNET